MQLLIVKFTIIVAPLWRLLLNLILILSGQMMDDDEPAAKRSRTEENLIPEGEFLARNHSPVTMKVMEQFKQAF